MNNQEIKIYSLKIVFLIFSILTIHCKSSNESSTLFSARETMGPNSREFIKIVEQNFVGKWQGQFIDKNSRIFSIELNVKSLGDNHFKCELIVPNEPSRFYSSSYQFSKNVLEGDGFYMSPILGGFADVVLDTHPIFKYEESIKFTLVPDP